MVSLLEWILNRQQGIDDLEKTVFSICWTQSIILLTKGKTQDEALFYVKDISVFNPGEALSEVIKNNFPSVEELEVEPLELED